MLYSLASMGSTAPFPTLTQTIGQQLVMTPRLRQAIEMLQMTHQDVNALLMQEMEANPFLVRAPQEADTAPAPAAFDPGTQRAGPGGRDGPGRTLEETLAQTPSLREHLEEQLHLALPPGPERAIGEMLIDQIDEQGYITAEPQVLAQHFGCSIKDIEDGLAIIRALDPTGIGAANLAQCLEIQISERGHMDAPMRALLENLPLLAKGDMLALRRATGLKEEDLRTRIAILRACAPRPSAGFDHTPTCIAIPDVLIHPLPAISGGGFAVELNPMTLPRVLLNNTYYAEVLRVCEKDTQSRAFVREKMESANWLIKALDQRARTILAVANSVVERQAGFFTYGPAYLAPMTLRDVASDIAMHESTVSRVCSDKFMGTPRGLLAFKFFFSSSLAGTGGRVAHAGSAVRERIRALVGQEDPQNPLSDDEIVRHLTTQGISVARRTVTKYRTALRIPSSTDRRRVACAAVA